MNIVLITTYGRPTLLQQTIGSLLNNAADRDSHHLTVVFDLQSEDDETPPMYEDVSIVVTKQGASRARNIGAGSIPKYRRQEHVMFVDDDCYFVKSWDSFLLDIAKDLPRKTIYSGYGHPFNHAEKHGYHFAKFPLLISSVAMMMSWETFDDVGPWDEPGGPGGSEDYALCMRATNKSYSFAVSDPQCVLHTGLISSKGEQIVGYKELAEQNDKLLDVYDIRGKVIFG